MDRHDELLVGILMVGFTAAAAAASLLWTLFTRPVAIAIWVDKF